jgi:hypothetical protein
MSPGRWETEQPLVGRPALRFTHEPQESNRHRHQGDPEPQFTACSLTTDSVAVAVEVVRVAAGDVHRPIDVPRSVARSAGTVDIWSGCNAGAVSGRAVRCGRPRDRTRAGGGGVSGRHRHRLRDGHVHDLRFCLHDGFGRSRARHDRGYRVIHRDGGRRCDQFAGRTRRLGDTAGPGSHDEADHAGGDGDDHDPSEPDRGPGFRWFGRKHRIGCRLRGRPASAVVRR